MEVAHAPLDLSVIVATYNRADVLDQTLGALREQDLTGDRYEVVVVDDASSDATAQILAEWAGRAVPFFRVLRQEKNSGAAAARNRGIRAARGEIVLFLGDDIIAPPGFLAAHLEAHRHWPEEEVAIAGPVRWWPGARRTATMRFLQKYVYAYPNASRPVEADDRIFYGCNTSLKRRFLLAGPLFDERFRGRDFEDVELGRRLTRRGMQLIFFPAAWAHHHHVQEIHFLMQRWRAAGRNSLLYEQRTGQNVFPSSSRLRWLKLLTGRLLSAPLQKICALLDGWNVSPLPAFVYRWLGNYAIALGREQARRQERSHGNSQPGHP